ncbi:MAG TPA: dihydrofolate reductase family protein [Roseiflexaceae bacterium]|nr:dihydrofolate reductase family protein [Roseiflexaceae bacterium]
MRKVIAGLFISLDGVVEAPEKWHFPYFNEKMQEAVGSSMADADAMLLGRVTYAEWTGYWPAQGDDDPVARYMNATPKFVVSRTLDTVEWNNSTLIKGDVAQQIASLKQQPGKNILLSGSGTLVQWLIQADLLDELRLLVHPVLVGSGKRLFTGGRDQKGLRLVDSQAFSTGVVQLIYAPAEPA